MQDWQERWEEFNRDSRAASEKTQVERARIEQLEHQLARLAAQRERLAARAGRSSTRPRSKQRIATLQARAGADARCRAKRGASQLRDVTEELQRLRERERELVQRRRSQPPAVAGCAGAA